MMTYDLQELIEISKSLAGLPGQCEGLSPIATFVTICVTDEIYDQEAIIDDRIYYRLGKWVVSQDDYGFWDAMKFESVEEAKSFMEEAFMEQETME